MALFFGSSEIKGAGYGSVTAAGVSLGDVKVWPTKQPVQFKSCLQYPGVAYNPGASLALPTHSPGDLLVLYASNFGGVSIPPAAGGNVPQWVQIASTDGLSGVWYAWATRSDHMTGSWDSGMSWYWGTASFSGVNTSTPIGGHIMENLTTTDIATAPLSLHDTSGSSAVLYMFHSYGSDIYTAPSVSSATERVRAPYTAPNGSKHHVGIFTKNVTANGNSVSLGTIGAGFGYTKILSLEIRA